MIRSFASTLAVIFAIALNASVTSADELVMFEQPGCPYCQAWNAEVGKTYAHTDEAKRLPLRRVELNETRPKDLTEILGVRFTPTFIVTHCGHEIDRIVGYSGSEAFWMQMDIDVKLLASKTTCRREHDTQARAEKHSLGADGTHLVRVEPSTIKKAP